MNISPKSARVDENNLWVELHDGRTLGVPLAWFPRLLAGTPEQRNDFDLSPRGVHWDTLNEDISIAGLLNGEGDITHHRREAA